MTKRMLIDAAHPEETRVVVVDGNRLEELDVESSGKKQLKGNIYLAKVVRVEPSLQAAFVDYGGNRHGFLAFNEIHPDYYQIPVADREALKAEEAVEEVANGESDGQNGNGDDTGGDHGGDDSVETVGGEASDELVRRRFKALKDYKIQEVIKRRQILLVQVVKEERGSKGAALTTYLSLAGRYCVLMPNTARGGGVSRKITSASDRRRLKTVLNALEIPEGMAVIVRTAGSQRSRAEIRRDYEYLVRLWNEIRESTLQSRAPALIYEEANLIKRSIRDLYARDIDEVLVEGEEGYRTAKDFMRTLMPSHARRVQLYRDPTMPLFHRYQVESQLDAMHSPSVPLRSGGTLVINPTEALVAIDINSGKATRERHIEETALKTNMEAAEEVARQLRLRDLAGLIVIDFIDMEDSRNISQVERRLKEAMKHDRARIQLGRISAFGLLELSRQRLRPSLHETSYENCPHCGGTGMVRSLEAAAVHALRTIEEEGIQGRTAELTVTLPPSVAFYLVNHKRASLGGVEERYGLQVMVDGDPKMSTLDLRLDRVRAAQPAPQPARVSDQSAQDQDESRKTTGTNRKRRRKKPRKEDTAEADAGAAETPAEQAAESAAETAAADMAEADDTAEADGGEVDSAGRRRPRRRGRRGGRRRKRRDEDGEGDEGGLDDEGTPAADDGRAAEAAGEDTGDSGAADGAPAPAAGADTGSDADTESPAGEPAPQAETAGEHEAVPERQAAEVVSEAPRPAEAQAPAADTRSSREKEAERPRKRGWWQRLLS